MSRRSETRSAALTLIEMMAELDINDDKAVVGFYRKHETALHAAIGVMYALTESGGTELLDALDSWWQAIDMVFEEGVDDVQG